MIVCQLSENMKLKRWRINAIDGLLMRNYLIINVVLAASSLPLGRIGTGYDYLHDILRECQKLKCMSTPAFIGVPRCANQSSLPEAALLKANVA